MNRSEINQQPQDHLSRAIGISLALHVVVFLALAVRAVFLPSEPLIIEDSIRVDIVGLPDKKKPQTVNPPAGGDIAKPKPVAPAPKPAPVEAPKPKPAPKVVQREAPKVNLNKNKKTQPKVDIDKAKRSQESALQRLESLNRLEKALKASREANENPQPGSPTQEPSTVVRGNQVNAGNSLTGLTRLSHQAYIRSLDQKVRQNWNLPQWLANANLKAKVRLYIDSQGFVVKKIMIQSSNNEVFDESVMNAIDASSPFSAPPDELVNILAVNGAEIEFDPNN